MNRGDQQTLLSTVLSRGGEGKHMKRRQSKQKAANVKGWCDFAFSLGLYTLQ